ncbi:MAG: DNA replication/repair protein RecF [Chloroflexota bacterium]
MILKHLSLTNFRNYARLDADLPEGLLLLVGDNAQGKTSLIEAIYFLSTLTSFHAESDRQLIQFFAAREPLAVARIVGDFQRGGKTHRLEVRIIHENGGLNGGVRVRKEVLLDGVKQKLAEAVGQFNAVIFLPHSLQIIEGTPEERRRFLNLALGQVIPNYTAALSEYGRALSQRNALLKQLNERGGDPSQLDFWDDELSEYGAMLIHARIQAVQELEQLASPLHLQLTQGKDTLRMDYQPSYDPLPQPAGQYGLGLDTAVNRLGINREAIQEGMKQRLKRLRQEEIVRGVTTIGPHRDELRFLGNGVDLGAYGSRGQVRTATLALKFAELHWMKGKTGEWPLFLLDEVLAELDPQRRIDLLFRLGECEQALLTTTDIHLFDTHFVRKANIWHVAAGQIQMEEARDES